MQFGIITLFQEMYHALNYGITGRAQQQRLINLHYFNPRDYSHDKTGHIDDRPYGGGPGMVMMVQPLRDAIIAAKKQLGQETKVAFMSPQGQQLEHQAVVRLAKMPKLIIIAGRYEGIDERVKDAYVDMELSIGDYVISGGELASMVLIDAICRQIPGSLGHEDSNLEDSFVNGLLDYPHYTRPEEIDGAKVPAVLRSGDHQAIQRWRKKQALGQTWLKRPELLALLALNDEETTLLNEFIAEYGKNHE